MDTQQQIADLSARVQADPHDIESRHTLGLLLLPFVRAQWPQGDATLDTNGYRNFISQAAIPVGDLLHGIETLDVADFIFQIVGGLHWIGEHERAELYVQRGLAIRAKVSATHPLYDKGIRFLQTRTGILTQFGHLIVEPDCYIRTGALGWRKPYKALMLIPERRCANQSLLRYWRKDICVVTDPELCTRLDGLSRTLEYDTFWMKVPKVGVRYGHAGIIASITAWEKEGRPAVLSLDPRHREKGWKILNQLGVKNGAWLVAAHVRHATTHTADKVPTRNSDITTYFDAYKEIVSRGGIVVRMGNPEMPKLPPMEGVIDLAHGERLPDWFDLFITAECRFFLGSASGPCSLAATFQKPLVMSNIPAHCFRVSHNDVFLPKLLRERKSGRLLTFHESLISKFQYIYNGNVYHEHGVELVENESDDLKEATIEIIEKLEGTFSSSEEDLYLQNRYDALASALEGYPIKCGLSKAFAQKHKNLILN